MSQRYITLSTQACDVFNEINFLPPDIVNVYLVNGTGASARLLKPDFKTATRTQPDARYDDSFTLNNDIEVKLQNYAFSIAYNQYVVRTDTGRNNFRLLFGNPNGTRDITDTQLIQAVANGDLRTTSYTTLRTNYKAATQDAGTGTMTIMQFGSLSQIAGRMISLPATSPIPYSTNSSFDIISPPASLVETPANSKTYRVYQNPVDPLNIDTNLRDALLNQLNYPLIGSSPITDTTALYLKFKPTTVLNTNNQNNQNIFLTIEREANRYFFKTVNVGIITNYSTSKIPAFNIVKIYDSASRSARLILRIHEPTGTTNDSPNKVLFDTFRSSPPENSQITSTSTNAEISSFINNQLGYSKLLTLIYTATGTTSPPTSISRYTTITNGPNANFGTAETTFILPDGNNDPNNYQTFVDNRGLSGLVNTEFEFVNNPPVAGSVNLDLQSAELTMIKSIPVTRPGTTQAKPYYLYWDGGSQNSSTVTTFRLVDYWLDNLDNSNIRRGLQFWWLDNTILSGKTEDYYRWTIHTNLANSRTGAGAQGGSTNVFVNDSGVLSIGNIKLIGTSPNLGVTGLEGWALQDPPESMINASPAPVLGAKALVYITSTNTLQGYMNISATTDAVTFQRPPATSPTNNFDVLPVHAYQWYCVKCTRVTGDNVCIPENNPNANLRNIMGALVPIDSFPNAVSKSNVNLIALNGPLMSSGSMIYLSTGVYGAETLCTLSNTPTPVTFEAVGGSDLNQLTHFRIRLGTGASPPYIGVDPNPSVTKIITSTTIPTSTAANRFAWKLKVIDNIVFNNTYYPVYVLVSVSAERDLSFSVPTTSLEDRVVRWADPNTKSVPLLRFVIDVPRFNPVSDLFRYASNTVQQVPVAAPAATKLPPPISNFQAQAVDIDIYGSNLMGSARLAEPTDTLARQTTEVIFRTNEYFPDNGVQLYFSVADPTNGKIWYISVDTTKGSATRSGTSSGSITAEVYNLRLTDDFNRRAVFEVVHLEGNTFFDPIARVQGTFALKYIRGPITPSSPPLDTNNFFIRHAFGILSIDRIPVVQGRNRDFVWRFLPSDTISTTGTFFCTSMFPYNNTFSGICWSNINRQTFVATNNVMNDNNPSSRNKLYISIINDNNATNYGITDTAPIITTTQPRPTNFQMNLD